MLKIKSLNSIIIAMPFVLLAACQSDAQTNQTTATLEKNTPKISSVETQPSDFREFINTLQGSWERTTYPYGTVEFQNNKVKFTEGEGAVKDAKFEDFKIADECPVTAAAESSALAYDFLVVADNDCNPIKINAGVLFIAYSGARDSIEYKKVSADNTAVAQAIPVNFRGKWAIGKENCKAKSPEQMQISANKLKFFKNEAELVAITQFEPTRLEAKFNYMINDSESTPYSYTLDLQNKSKVLIMREYGNDSRPGLFKYDKCQ